MTIVNRQQPSKYYKSQKNISLQVIVSLSPFQLCTTMLRNTREQDRFVRAEWCISYC